MAPPRFYYSPAYRLSWEGQVFSPDKYHLLAARLLGEGLVGQADLAPPPPLCRQELGLVHSGEYLDRLEAMTVDPAQGFFEIEAPLTRPLLEGFLEMAGGTLAACRAALARQGSGGFAANLGGGFHHAFPWRGGGFCPMNDLAVALRVLLAEGRIGRAAVVDLDVHQGNGTARAFEGEERVFTFSLHEEENYPVKTRSDLDIGLPGGTGDEAYLAALDRGLPEVRGFGPDLVLYLAGADPYREDRLGGLALSLEGLEERDRRVFGAFSGEGIPVAAALGGGYPEKVEDVVEVHFRMIRQGLGLGERGPRRP